MAQPNELAAQEHDEALISCRLLERRYPVLDEREDTAIRSLEQLARELVAFVPRAWQPVARERVARLAQAIWQADAAADRYVLETAGDAAISLERRNRHLRMAQQAQQTPTAR